MGSGAASITPRVLLARPALDRRVENGLYELLATTNRNRHHVDSCQSEWGDSLASPRHPLRFLIDTNIFIATEPRSDREVEPQAMLAARLLRRIGEAGHSLEVHPAGLTDIRRDGDAARRHAREVQHARYPSLPEPPDVPESWRDRRSWREGDNDHVDLLHLAALEAHAASFLITEDRRLLRWAAELQLDDRVVTIGSGHALLDALHELPAEPPPTVDRVFAHTLDPKDPIFQGLREAYQPDFDDWFQRVREQRRTALAIHNDSGSLSGLALIKLEEDGNDAQLPGRVMKISTLKVADEARGARRGELLLKALFREAADHRADGIYLTVFAESQPALVATLGQFGFEASPHVTERGEAIYAKRLATPTGLQHLDTASEGALDFHVAFGPPALHPEHGQSFVVPITPAFSRRLFPDASLQQQLIEPDPYGNAIRKAYLSRASTRQVARGDILAFYESGTTRGPGGRGTARGVFAVGVVERVLASDDPGGIAETVGTRTVYSLSEIREMTQSGDILALIFRQDRLLTHPIALPELMRRGALEAQPQSITRVRSQGATWLRQRIQE